MSQDNDTLLEIHRWMGDMGARMRSVEKAIVEIADVHVSLATLQKDNISIREDIKQLKKTNEKLSPRIYVAGILKWVVACFFGAWLAIVARGGQIEWQAGQNLQSTTGILSQAKPGMEP